MLEQLEQCVECLVLCVRRHVAIHGQVGEKLGHFRFAQQLQSGDRVCFVACNKSASPFDIRLFGTVLAPQSAQLAPKLLDWLWFVGVDLSSDVDQAARPCRPFRMLADEFSQRVANVAQGRVGTAQHSLLIELTPSTICNRCYAFCPAVFCCRKKPITRSRRMGIDSRGPTPKKTPVRVHPPAVPNPIGGPQLGRIQNRHQFLVAHHRASVDKLVDIYTNVLMYPIADGIARRLSRITPRTAQHNSILLLREAGPMGRRRGILRGSSVQCCESTSNRAFLELRAIATRLQRRFDGSGITKACTGAAIRSWKNGCVIRRGPVTPVVMPERQSCDIFDIQSHRVLEASRS